MKNKLMAVIAAVLMMQASYAASVKVLNSTGVEGTEVVFKGKNIHSAANPQR